MIYPISKHVIRKRETKNTDILRSSHNQGLTCLLLIGAGRLLALRRPGHFQKAYNRGYQTDPPIHPSFLEMNLHKFYILWEWPPPDCCGNYEYSRYKSFLSSPHTLSTVMFVRWMFAIYGCCIFFIFIYFIYLFAHHCKN